MRLELKMEVLTPLHVGSGEDMLNEIDYIKCKKDGVPLVVDQHAVFRQLAEKGISDVGAVRTIDVLLQRLGGEAPGYRLQPLHGGNTIPKSIRQQLKDAHWRPLIPGSSLKGAIRTALLAEWLRSPKSQNSRQRHVPSKKGDPKKAAKLLVEDFFSSNAPKGKPPNFDWMRIWKVGDVTFNTNALRLADVRFMNLVDDSPPPYWKNMSDEQKPNLPIWRNAHGVHVEALGPGALATYSIVLDEVLYQKAHKRLHWEQATRDFDGLRTVLNAHAGYRLEQERDFYSRYGHDAAAQACERVQAVMKRDTKAIYLQMGWGSGWRGMTGDWQRDAGIEKKMRDLYNLEKKGFPIFPKTRRLVVAGGKPSLPFGWVRLWRKEDTSDIRRSGVKLLPQHKSPAQIARERMRRSTTPTR